MTPAPLHVVIVIVNWNGRDHTLRCLDSLKRLDYAGPVTRVLVDNASTDGSIDAVMHAYPDVKVLALDENRRFAGGCNAGIEYGLAAGAEALLLLNNDTWLAPSALTYLVAALDLPNRAITAPRIYYADSPSRIWACGGRVSLAWGRCSMIGHDRLDSPQYDASRVIHYAVGAAMLVHRSVFDRAGLLNPDYYHSGEDVDISLRARAAGFQIVYVPQAHVWHQVSASTGGVYAPATLFYLFRGLALLRQQHLTAVMRWLTTPLFMIYVMWSMFRQAIILRNPEGTSSVVLAMNAAMHGAWLTDYCE